MRNPELDFLLVVAFLVGFLLFTLGETEWLRRRTKAETYLLLLVTFASNILSLILLYFFSYIIFLIGVLAFGARETPALAVLIYVIGVCSIAVTPLAIIKRLFLTLTRVHGLAMPWTYSVLAALAFQLSMLGLTLVVAYIA